MPKRKSRHLFPLVLVAAVPATLATSCGGLRGDREDADGGSGGAGGSAGGSGGGSGGYGIGGYCFAEGTLIDTPSGRRPIEELRPSDLVLTYDAAERVVRARPLLRVTSHAGRPVGHLALEGGGTLRVTPEHPFYLPETGEYVPVSKLREETRLLHLTSLRDGSFSATSTLTEGYQAPELEVATVYDLTVAEEHNFFAEGVLVHNKSPITGGAAGTGGSSDCCLTYLPEPYGCVGEVQNLGGAGNFSVVTTDASQAGQGGQGGGTGPGGGVAWIGFSEPSSCLSLTSQMRIESDAAPIEVQSFLPKNGCEPGPLSSSGSVDPGSSLSFDLPRGSTAAGGAPGLFLFELRTESPGTPISISVTTGCVVK
jgi:hypothetical protein